VKETNTLTAGGASTYTWISSPSTGTLVGSAVTVTPNVATVIVYTVTGKNAYGCSSTAVLQMTVNKCTAIQEWQMNSNKLNVYPNPNNGEFTIASETDMNLSIVNQLGQVIKQIRLDEKGNYQYIVSGISPGIYFITGDRVNLKIVVDK
jgi:hypothetical protein